MAGGLGRAQGGYDEMVFRAMVRDKAHFYDPLGLASRAVRVNFQVGVNAYLYGTRFFTYLALRPFAGEGRRVDPARRRQPSATTPTSSSRCSAFRWSRPGRTGSPSSANSSSATSRKSASFRSRRSSNLAAKRDRFDLADVLRRGERHPLRRLSLPRRGRSRRGAEHARWQRAAARRHQARRCCTGSLRWPTTRPAARSSSSTTTSAYRDLMAVDLKTGEERMLLEDARIGEIVFNPVDRSLWGVRQANGLAALVRIRLSLHRVAAGAGAPLRVRSLRPRHLAGRPAAVGIGERSQRRPVPARVGDSTSCWPGT